MTSRRVLRDIAFAQYTGFRPLSLDVHLPEKEAPAPVILQLHGGGWRQGSRAVFSPLVSAEDSFGRMVAAGFAVVAADYRLSGEAVFPAQLDDVRAALAWIGTKGAEYGLDAQRIVLWGGSAGGTLAALVGLESNAAVRGVIDWYGPSDLLAMAEHTRSLNSMAPTREDEWLGAPVLDVPAIAAAASPVTHAHAGAPPFHIAHGEADIDVPPQQSTQLAAALERAGVDVELHLEPDAGHFWKGLADHSALFDSALSFASRVTSGRGD
jgi:acetyl esterase/lipase